MSLDLLSLEPLTCFVRIIKTPHQRKHNPNSMISTCFDDEPHLLVRNSLTKIFQYVIYAETLLTTVMDHRSRNSTIIQIIIVRFIIVGLLNVY